MSKSLVLLLIALLCASILLIAVRPSYGDVTTNSWVTRAPMPTARSDLGTAVVDNKIYAIGGLVLFAQDQEQTQSKEVGVNEVYDPTNNSWTERSSMPIPSSDFATAVYQGKIYCIGGGVTNVFNESTQTWESKNSEGFNQVYDPLIDKWENKTAMPIPEISSQANVLNGKIYLLGGYPNASIVEMYNPASDSWTIMTPIPVGFNGASVVYDNKLYAIGSMNWNQPQTIVYDPQNNSWSIEWKPSDFIGQSIAVATSGAYAPQKIYVLTIPIGSPTNTVIENKVFDPTNQSWAEGSAVPTTRGRGYSIVIDNDLIYVIGGYSSSSSSYYQNPSITYLATVEEYIPYGFSTVPISPSPSPSLPELSWFVILPLLLSVFAVAAVLRHRKISNLSKDKNRLVKEC
jgi:N-acetylneuraminic acid mutarotase